MWQAVERWAYHPSVVRSLVALGGLLVVVVLVRLVQRTLTRYLQDTTTRYRARKFTAFLGYALAILVLLVVYSDKLGGLHIALGVAGAGIAFALQEVIVSIAGWLAIVFSNFYKTGDRIRLGGVKGDVIDIGILRTTVMEIGEWVNGDLYNGRVVRVANSFVFKEPVYNYSGDFPFLWDEMTLPVRYGSEHRLALQILQRVAEQVVGEYTHQAQAAWNHMVKKYRIEDARVAPLVTLTADENWMTYTVRYVVDYKQRRIVKNQLFLEILEALEATRGRVTIASASMDITLTPSSPSDLRPDPREE